MLEAAVAIARTVARLGYVGGVIARPALIAALPLGFGLMLWELADAQRGPEPPPEPPDLTGLIPVGCGDGEVGHDEPRQPPPPYVVRDFRTDPIDDEEISDLADGRTQALADR